jgi:phosphoenolpyruvate phosphomutase
VLRIGPEVRPEEAHGEFIGMAMFSAPGAARLRAVHDELAAGHAEGLDRATVPQLLQALVDRGQPVVAVDIYKGWMEIDSFEDYRRAWAEAR